MVCLVEMPESAGVSLGKVSNFLSKRAPSVPSDMKRELAALGAPRQLERSPGAKTRTPRAVAQELKQENKLGMWGTDQLKNQRVAAVALGRDDKIKEIDAELERRGVKGQSDALNIKAKTVERSAAPVSASGGTRYARGDASDFDKDLTEGSLKRVGDTKYFGWNDSYKSGSRAVGEGAFGTVIRNADGTFVKRGAISDTEANLIQILGQKGIGPKLIAADINGNHPWHSEDFVNIRKGRIAMSGVPGRPMGTVDAKDKIGGEQASDIYWRALGALHRLGIAHNDAHIDNILVDEKGKGRWVDLGLAQRSPKAALAEALGSFSGGGANSREGNWQTRRWDATGIPAWERHDRTRAANESFRKEHPVLGRITGNRAKMFNQMREYGLSSSDYAQMVETPIRSKLSVYEEGPWAKLTDAQAQSLINTLYDGI